MPILKESTIARNKQRLIKLSLQHNGSPTEIAKVLGVTPQAVGAQMSKYGTRESLAEIAAKEGLTFPYAFKKLKEHADNGSEKAIDTFLKYTTGGTEDHRPLVHINHVNILSEAFKEAQQKYYRAKYEQPESAPKEEVQGGSIAKGEDKSS